MARIFAFANANIRMFFTIRMCQYYKKKTFEFANIRNKHSVVFFTPEVHKVINSMSPYPCSIML